jgi:hypothetical protein
MKVLKWSSLLTVILIQMLTLSSFANATAGYPQIFPTNHFMTYNISFTQKGNIITDGTVANLLAELNGVCSFKTLDQFTCNAGTSHLKMQIVSPVKNQVIASTQPITIDAPYRGFVYTQTANWQVLFPNVGWYRYEILAENQPVAYYYFVVSYAITP